MPAPRQVNRTAAIVKSSRIVTAGLISLPDWHVCLPLDGDVLIVIHPLYVMLLFAGLISHIIPDQVVWGIVAHR